MTFLQSTDVASLNSLPLPLTSSHQSEKSHHHTKTPSASPAPSMHPLLLSLFLACLLITLYFPPKAQSYEYYTKCGTIGNSTNSTIFQSNLDSLFSSLISDTPASGYANITNGSNPNQVYALALCRGDVDASVCSNCVLNATQSIKSYCPRYQSGVIWYDDCLLRYSNERFFSSINTTDLNPVWSANNLTGVDFDRFDQLLQQLMDAISLWAAYNSTGNTVSLFGTGEVNINATSTLYGLVQCTRDLSRDQCYQCLHTIIESFQTCCMSKIEGRILGPSCIAWFEFNQFYATASNVVLHSSPAATTPATTVGNNKNKGVIVLAAAISVIATILFISISLYRRRSAKKLPRDAFLEVIMDTELLFDLHTLRAATADFSESKKLGEGGFGAVYKGQLSDRQEIAVKRLSQNSSQGLAQLRNEFVLLVAKLRHRNLVRILGVCLEEQEKLLVYEFVQNGSLDAFLFDLTKRKELNWGRRYKIILGIAQGLLYLHEDSRQKIIHRDLKASNILLDANLNPKISDFGLARLFDRGQTHTRTGVVAGTFGYMAPEYVIHGQISVKSDVFSFGILVLEIVTGRRNTSFDDSEQSLNLIHHTWKHWTRGASSEIIDPSLQEHYSRSEVARCIQIGLLCVEENPAQRPSMAWVVGLLLNTHSTMLAPSRPAFCAGLLSQNEPSTSSGTSLMSLNEMSISELAAR